MKSKCSFSFFMLFFVLSANCKENNVCPTIADYYTLKENPNCWYDIAAEANVPDIITYYGYPVEDHKVVTPDGYILTVFRIPNYGPGEKAAGGKGPVFLQHGFFGSSANFVALGNQSLVFLLADAGYDVWIGNFRGVEYSEGHLNLTVFDKQYWRYSADHLALYDVPAQLKYITQTTGQKGNIVYIGHSLGTLTAFMYGSALPKEAKRTVKLFILLGPAAQVTNTKSLLARATAKVIDGVTKVVEDNDLIRLASQADPLKKIFQHVCLESPLLMLRCWQLASWLIAGPKMQMAESTLPILFHQAPAGMSLYILKHSGSIFRDGLRRYDYGLKNEEVYGAPVPPPYDISKIKVPILMMTSTDDLILTAKDALISYGRLHQKAKIYGIRVISNANFNHIDYVYGKHAKTIVYDPILRLLEQIG